MLKHETRFRVRYAETDQMGVVYYANYYVWMEVGRVELCRALGVEYKQMEIEDGVFLAVAESQCRYLSPARYDEEIVIETRLENAHTRMVTFGYSIRRASDGLELATGKTKHIFCGIDMKPKRLPERSRASFGIA
jgi:acyl-CoA thioester hydrolase